MLCQKIGNAKNYTLFGGKSCLPKKCCVKEMTIFLSDCVQDIKYEKYRSRISNKSFMDFKKSLLNIDSSKFSQQVFKEFN